MVDSGTKLDSRSSSSVWGRWWCFSSFLHCVLHTIILMILIMTLRKLLGDVRWEVNVDECVYVCVRLCVPDPNYYKVSFRRPFWHTQAKLELRCCSIELVWAEYRWELCRRVWKMTSWLAVTMIKRNDGRAGGRQASRKDGYNMRSLPNTKFLSRMILLVDCRIIWSHEASIHGRSSTWS